MAQDIEKIRKQIEEKLNQVNTRFAEKFPGLEANRQVEYWPETLGEDEDHDSLNYKFLPTCPGNEELRQAIREAIAAGAKPDYNVVSNEI